MSFQSMKGAPMFTIAKRFCFQICFHPVASQLYFCCHFPQLCCCFTNDSFTVSLTTNQFNSLLCCKGDAANGKNTPSKHQSKHSSSIIEGSIKRHNWETYCTCIYQVSLSSRVSGFSWKTSVTLQKNKKCQNKYNLSSYYAFIVQIIHLWPWRSLNARLSMLTFARSSSSC